MQALLRARKELAPLRRGATLNLWAGEQTWAYARRHEGQTVVVALNNGTAAGGGGCAYAARGMDGGPDGGGPAGRGLRPRTGRPAARDGKPRSAVILTAR